MIFSIYYVAFDHTYFIFKSSAIISEFEYIDDNQASYIEPNLGVLSLN